jgi:hypothetical protein
MDITYHSSSPNSILFRNSYNSLLKKSPARPHNKSIAGNGGWTSEYFSILSRLGSSCGWTLLRQGIVVDLEIKGQSSLPHRAGPAMNPTTAAIPAR